MYTENDFELAISFIKGLFEFLTALSKANAVPDSNQTDGWTLNASYYYDNNDRMRVFSPSILMV